MPLDPHAKKLLETLNAAGVADMSRMAPQQMRAGFERLVAMVGMNGVAVDAAEDRALPGPGGTIPIRVYTPKDGGAATLPGLIYFHGGGGVFGSIASHDSFCRVLANASACRIVSVGYRLAPEHKFPAAVEDAYAATCFIAAHAREFRIDPHRLAVGGDSIGGGLAAVVCRMARDEGGPAIALQVLLCPIVDLSSNSDSRIALATGYFLNQATIDWTVKHYCAPDADLADPRISPLLAEDLSRLPPAQVHTAEFDPLRSEGAAYAERLQCAGVAVRHTCHAGMIHHFYAMGGVIPYARTAVAAAGDAIRSAFE
ncbi:MAG TPA: alpha/beta hydrolase [Xanthobacteraceae bacterium]|jgi:acetyl esterase/lipase|nr:alpha/beta hydrolase [Xanthobacteraceae bacterium]